MGADLAIPARWFTRTDGRRVDVVVWHSGETLERGDSAEGMGRYFASLPADRKASAHYGCDVNTTVAYVDEKDVAYAAPGANHDGVQVELAGRAGQSLNEWLDDYSRAMLHDEASPLGAELTERHRLPLAWLTPAELRAGARGHTSHANVSLAFRKSSHWDPGPNFPAPLLMQRIATILGGPTMPTAPRPGFEDLGPFVWVRKDSPEEGFWRAYLPVSRYRETHRLAAIDPTNPPPSAGNDPVVYVAVKGWGGSRLGATRVETLENMLADAFGVAVDLP